MVKLEERKPVELKLAEAVRVAALPAPTAWFRRRAWQAYQRALDPLAQPRPLPRS